jgi:hypothetical protein
MNRRRPSRSSHEELFVGLKRWQPGYGGLAWRLCLTVTVVFEGKPLERRKACSDCPVKTSRTQDRTEFVHVKDGRLMTFTDYFQMRCDPGLAKLLSGVWYVYVFTIFGGCVGPVSCHHPAMSTALVGTILYQQTSSMAKGR